MASHHHVPKRLETLSRRREFLRPPNAVASCSASDAEVVTEEWISATTIAISSTESLRLSIALCPISAD